jgi:beta-glucosidase
MSSYVFRKFLWGTATSAFQIEGGIENDFTQWEAQGKFQRDHKDPRVGMATDHWNRWEEDFRLLRELRVNSYRFSIEWARVEPEPGRYDQKAIDQYSRMIDRLLEYDIVPMLTLHHFTQPTWFHARSPWHSNRSVESFVRYVDRITPCLLDRVPLVVTINEPLVWLLAAYADAKFPPGHKNWQFLMIGLHNMLLAHRETYDLVKSQFPACRLGIAHNFISFKRAPHGSFLDRDVKRVIHRFYNHMIPKSFRDNRLKFSFPLLFDFDEPVPLDDRIDFWGVNYYYRLHVKFRFRLHQPFELLSIARSSGEGKSDLGWEIYPNGLRKVCRWLRPMNKPIIITENGIACDDDTKRVRFIESHLAAVAQIRKENPNLAGYYYWSLLDNYEWLEGHAARFGLVDVDHGRNLARTIKPSGRYYSQRILADTEDSPAS